MSDKMTLRKCSNIKSKKQPDQRCTSEAIHGEFCNRHQKKPTRWPLRKENNIIYNARINSILTTIQKSYKLRNGLRRFLKQGPATSDISLAENSTEIYSLEPLNTIPILYRFSFEDLKHHIFLFDIRSLYQLIESCGYTLTNPYTREPIHKNVVDKLISRITYLRKKKFCLIISQEIELSSTQLLHQRIVDVCLKFDFLGFYTSPEWFENLTLKDLKSIYINIYSMFITYPVADIATLKSVYPGTKEELFQLRISGINNRKDKMYLEYALLDLFEKLITTAPQKENRCLGATYVLKAWATSYTTIYINYPWLI
jgi:hypothetical protein